MGVEFRIAEAARVTGELLERLVRARVQASGRPEPDCVVCYGTGYSGDEPTLNNLCSLSNKLGQAKTLWAALKEQALYPIPISKTSATLTNPESGTPIIIPENLLPLVARRIKHSKGRDIRLCRTLKGLTAMLRKGRHDFVTSVQPSDTEYRVWVYRKRILAVYEKRLTEPEKNVKFGRNRDNGWTFHALTTEEIPPALREVSRKALAALSLDFGAVDVLGSWLDEDHTDIRPVVLEVNSAPGVSDEHRTCIVKLANRIASWILKGCPARS